MGAVELLAQDVRPGRLAGIVRAGQAENQRLVGHARQRTRLDRRTADLGVRHLAEQGLETADLAVEQRPHGFRYAVVVREARAACRDDDLYVGVGDPVAEDAANLVPIALDDVAPHAFVAGLRQAFRQQVAGRVVSGCARVADGEYGAGKRDFLGGGVHGESAGVPPVSQARVRSWSASRCSTQKLRPPDSVSRFQNGARVFNASIMYSQPRNASPRCALAAATNTICALRGSAPTRWAMTVPASFQRCCAVSAMPCSSRSHMPG